MKVRTLKINAVLSLVILLVMGFTVNFFQGAYWLDVAMQILFGAFGIVFVFGFVGAIFTTLVNRVLPEKYFPKKYRIPLDHERMTIPQRIVSKLLIVEKDDPDE